MLKLYNDTVEITFMPKSHRYKADGVFVPGVSTILGVLAKDLGGWMVYMAVNSFAEDVEQFATTERKMTKIAFNNVLDRAKKAHTVKSQHGMDVGTVVHNTIAVVTDDYLITGDFNMDTLLNPTLPDGADDTFKAQVKNALAEWQKWVIKLEVVPIKSERVVYSKKLGYCGTYDILFKSNKTGKTYMGDYKTSDPMKVRNYQKVIIGHKAYPEHFMQCSAYDYAYNEEVGQEVDGYAVIYLPKEGDYHMFTREAVKTDREGWELLFKTYQWQQQVKKTK